MSALYEPKSRRARRSLPQQPPDAVRRRSRSTWLLLAWVSPSVTVHAWLTDRGPLHGGPQRHRHRRWYHDHDHHHHHRHHCNHWTCHTGSVTRVRSSSSSNSDSSDQTTPSLHNATVAQVAQPTTSMTSSTIRSFPTRTSLAPTRSVLDDPTRSPERSLERTAAHLQKLQLHHYRTQKDTASSLSSFSSPSSSVAPDPLGDERERLVQSYVQQPASELKRLLKSRDMPIKGRKPDLARRLAMDDLVAQYGALTDHGKEYFDDDENENDLYNQSETEQNLDATTTQSDKPPARPTSVVSTFAGVKLSAAAATALTSAQFRQASSIQAQAIPWITGGSSTTTTTGSSRGGGGGKTGQSCLLHAATGSGKTLAYLLPITERLWNEPPDSDARALILTPTRELAAQVAGIASVLSPPGTVRLVSRPMDLTARLPVERSQLLSGGAALEYENVQPRIFVGSATAIQHSLYGDGKLPASPTSKPEAMWILQNTAYIVLDEVDRLLNVVGGTKPHSSSSSSSSHGGGGRGHGSKKSKAAKPTFNDDTEPHEQPVAVVEMPAAILTAAVMRLTLGKAIVVAASATVGRPLKRELARCMGLTPQECPPTIRDEVVVATGDGVAAAGSILETTLSTATSSVIGGTLTTRAVTIPDTVRHFVVPVVEGTSPGKILTSAFTAIQSLYPTQPRMLLVLTKNFGITISNTIGALKHFKCQPEPVSLLDALEADGTHAMMEVHRQVTGATGVGASMRDTKEKGYLFVTGEDSVRGLHLDGLNVVLVAGRPAGPDEYTHIAGRTGRAGLSGCVVNILSDQDAGKLVAWEKMLGIRYTSCESPKLVGAIVSEREWNAAL